MSVNVYAAMRSISGILSVQILAMEELRKNVLENLEDKHEAEKIILDLNQAKERLDLLRGDQ